MPPTSQQRWGGRDTHTHIHTPPPQPGHRFPTSGCSWKRHLGWGGGDGRREHPGWAVSPVPVPRGDPKARSPPRSWGWEERPGLRGEVEGPAGATGETERRPRVGLPSRRAKGGGSPAPSHNSSSLGLWDPPRCGGWGAPGRGTQPGLSSPQLPGGQKCPFRRWGAQKPSETSL